MTTFPISPPTTPGFTKVSFRLDRTVGVTESPFDRTEQVYVHPGNAWMGTVSLPLMNAAQGAQWAAFINRLAGRSGTFTMAPPDRETPRGTQTANFTVNGAHAAQLTSLVVTMTASKTLLAGDRISIASKLHEVVIDATADGAGAATLEIEPPLRDAMAGGETVVCNPPQILLRLSANNAGLTSDHRRLFSLTFAFREA